MQSRRLNFIRAKPIKKYGYLDSVEFMRFFKCANDGEVGVLLLVPLSWLERVQVEMELSEEVENNASESDEKSIEYIDVFLLLSDFTVHSFLVDMISYPLIVESDDPETNPCPSGEMHMQVIIGWEQENKRVQLPFKILNILMDLSLDAVNT